MDIENPGPPGSHPHLDRRNWHPGDDDGDDLLIQKIADALRDGKSERQIAKLLGLSRTQIWRAKMMARIPTPLWERLFEARSAGRISLDRRTLVAIGRALQNGVPLRAEIECCPNCGHQLRVRGVISQSVMKVVADWLTEREQQQTAGGAAR
jgi:hypothetical protein